PADQAWCHGSTSVAVPPACVGVTSRGSRPDGASGRLGASPGRRPSCSQRSGPAAPQAAGSEARCPIIALRGRRVRGPGGIARGRRGYPSGIEWRWPGTTVAEAPVPRPEAPPMAEDIPFADFLGRIRAGDEQAAAELVRRYESAVRIEVRMRLADSRLRRILDTMDICQSGLARFFLPPPARAYDPERPPQPPRPQGT